MKEDMMDIQRIEDYKNVIWVHHSILNTLIIEFTNIIGRSIDGVGCEYLVDRNECAVYFNEDDLLHGDKLNLQSKFGEWDINPDYLNEIEYWIKELIDE